MLLVPRIGLRPFLKRLDRDNYVAIYMGEETLEGKPCHIIKLVPLKQKEKIILATVWIRQQDLLIGRWEAFTRKSGRIQADMSYREEVLPSKVVFSFDVSGMNVPLKYFGNKMELDQDLLADREELKGKITLHFNNYRITYLDKTK
jgi:hypothetical protein